jgi:hypothetical protein
MLWIGKPVHRAEGEMASLRITLLAACCIAVYAPLAAATVAIEGDRPRERVSVTVQDASIAAALRGLAEAYGFEVKGALGEDQAVSTTLSGTLSDVLARLLRNVNHVIVRSPDHRSGIAKVVITGSGRAPQPAAADSTGSPRPPSALPSDPAPMDDD